MCEIFIPGERGDVHQSEIRAHIRDEETRVRRYLREFFSKNFLLITLIRIELKAILKVRTSCTRSHSTKVTYAHFVPALESVRQFLPQMAPHADLVLFSNIVIVTGSLWYIRTGKNTMEVT